MLSVQIKKRMGPFSLDIAFESGDGTTGLLGASGSGKSMTLRCIAGIERPDSGRIVLNGRTLFDSGRGINRTPQERRVGYLFQHGALFPTMTVRENIAAGARYLNRSQRHTVITDQITRLHLTGLENHRPSELSGGEQQRVALARILVGAPELLLLDEPFTALDDYLRWQLEMEVADVLSCLGRPAIFVSHSRDEIYRLCERVCILSNGRSEREMAVQQLFHAPATLSAALLAGCRNFSRVALTGNGMLSALDWGITLPAPNGGLTCPDYIGVHAHALRPAAVGEQGVRCRVERAVDNISNMTLLLRPSTGTKPLQEASSPASSRLQMEMAKGQWMDLGTPKELTVHFRPEDILFLHRSDQKGKDHDQGN